MLLDLVLARTCTEIVTVLAGDIGQSGLVPGQEKQNKLARISVAI